MYRVDRAVKADPARQWALPDRVFFAAGACQVLAYAAVEAFGAEGFAPFWIRPAGDYSGNHIFVTDGERAFDFHGWSRRTDLLDHATRKWRRWRPDWACEVLPIAVEALVSEAKSAALGIRMREPGQFLHAPLPRARAFIAAHPPPVCAASR